MYVQCQHIHKMDSERQKQLFLFTCCNFQASGLKKQMHLNRVHKHPDFHNNKDQKQGRKENTSAQSKVQSQKQPRPDRVQGALEFRRKITSCIGLAT